MTVETSRILEARAQKLLITYITVIGRRKIPGWIHRVEQQIFGGRSCAVTLPKELWKQGELKIVAIFAVYHGILEYWWE